MQKPNTNSLGGNGAAQLGDEPQGTGQGTFSTSSQASGGLILSVSTWEKFILPSAIPSQSHCFSDELAGLLQAQLIPTATRRNWVVDKKELKWVTDKNVGAEEEVAKGRCDSLASWKARVARKKKAGWR